MRHIAICIDAEEAARPALAGARRVRGRVPAQLSVLHVRPAAARTGGAQAGERGAAARGSVVAELIASELPGAEAHVLDHADPVAGILEWAETHEPDLIVVSARAAPGSRAPLGPVAQAVLDAAGCSVLAARPAATTRVGEYVHVGACIDLSEDTLAVLEEARPLVSDERILDLVHVVGQDAERQRIAGGLVRTLATAVHAEPVILEGDPATELLAWQRRIGADLVVVAAGRPGAPARGIGQVAAAIAAQAPCDVLVARCERPSGCVEAIPPAGMIAVDE